MHTWYNIQKRARGALAEITILLVTQEKNCTHSMLCRLSRQKGQELAVVQEPGTEISVALKQEVDKYCLIDFSPPQEDYKYVP
jgi:hypothetical protein